MAGDFGGSDAQLADRLFNTNLIQPSNEPSIPDVEEDEPAPPLQSARAMQRRRRGKRDRQPLSVANQNQSCHASLASSDPVGPPQRIRRIEEDAMEASPVEEASHPPPLAASLAGQAGVAALPAQHKDKTGEHQHHDECDSTSSFTRPPPSPAKLYRRIPA